MIKLRHYMFAFAVLCSSIVLSSSASAACPCTVWSSSTVPATVDGGDPTAVEVGVRIRADVSGFITGVRFYKSAANSGTHIASVWTNSGTLLASATFAGESASGWQEADFGVPVLISPNTTYVASYYDPKGHYSFNSTYFTQTFDNPPLHALQDGLDGPNGNYSLGHAFPVNGYQSSNYWVDVVFVPENTTSTPTVLSVVPANGTSGVSASSTVVTAVFDQAMTASTINGTTFQLLDPSNNPVAGTVAYNPATQVATFTPTTQLSWSTTYTASVQGGANGVLDSNGNAMTGNVRWAFTTQAGPPSTGPGGPILVISSVLNPYTQYLSEILNTEGFNEYTATDISEVTASTLANYDIVILGDTQLSSSQVSMLSNWVQGGGNLIVMHPDPQLAGLLGLTPLDSSLSNAYLLVQTSTTPGSGIVGQTMQYHGSADLYSLDGASAIATLYSNSVTPTASPAVTTNQIGMGQAAAFTYDLARSVSYTRQGNPAWSGQSRDGQGPPMRPDDLFFGAASFDPEPDWVDLSKVAVPQADEQQRLLANLILKMESAKKPLPRFWYFPSGFKAVVVMTGDDHGSYYGGGATIERFSDFIADSPSGCSVADWQCVRATSYLFPQLEATNSLTDSQAASYVAQGFEIAAHMDSYSPSNCSDWTATSLDSFYSEGLASFASQFPSVPAPKTHRMHCVSWSDYDDQPLTELRHGIRLDTTYYYWPPSWINNVPGMFTGSGMPMRFTDRSGNLIDVYQATTQMTDESDQTYPFNIDTLLSNATGATGYYGAFVANMHNDQIRYPGPGANEIVASAQAHGVPVVSAAQMLTWLDGRNGSSFGSISWSGSSLSFTIRVGTGGRNLQVLIPTNSVGGTLTGITLNGNSVNYTIQSIKGMTYATFVAIAGLYQATYSPQAVANLTPVSILFGNQVVNTISAAQTVQLSNAGTAQMTINSISLSGANPADFAQTNNCGSSLAAGASCTISVTFTPLNTGSRSATLVVSDSVTGSPQTAALSGTGTAAPPPPATCPCSVWNTSTVPATVDGGDPTAVEVGFRFRSDSTGFINGVRFYKSSANTGTHTAHLWTNTGTLLGTATFTGESPSGWQEVDFSSPVPIAANTTYVASYVDPNGHYSFNSQYFSINFDNPPLHALADGVDGPDGNYAVGSGFPTFGYQSSNYWIDVVFVPATAALSSITLNPTVVIGGTGSTGTVTLTAPAPSGGAVVTLSSGDSSVQVPTSVTVTAGTTSATFSITTTAVAASKPVIISGTYGATQTATLTVTPPAAMAALSLSPATVQGGVNSTGTVTLNGVAPSGGAVVTLASNNTAAATVPTSVTVPAGNSSVTFTVTTFGVSANTTAVITATYGGSATASLTVNAAVVSSVTLSPASVTGGSNSIATVTLTGVAPAGGAVVTLSSGNTAAAQVPATITVSGSSTSSTFTVTTNSVTATTTSVITATYGTSASATLTVNPLSLSTLSLSPTTVVGGNNSTGTVTLNSAAPSGGTVVTLASSNTTAATVPGTVTVPAGSTSAKFTVTTLGVAANTSSVITGILGVSANATLTVTAASLSSVTRSPSPVVGGNNSTGTVTLNGAAPPTGAVVALSSSNTSAAQVPANVTIVAGSRSATFTISTNPVATNTSVTISATYGVTRTTTLTVTAPTLSSLIRSPTSVVGGNNSTGTVTLNGTAAAGGAVVTLSSNNTSAAQVPASVAIAAGSKSATFTITTSGIASSTSVTISAVYGTTRTTTLTVSVASLTSLTLNPSTVTGGTSSTGTLTLNGAAPPSGAVVSLTSSNTTAAQVPSTATIPAGASDATFTVTTGAVHGTSSTIRGTYLSTTRSATLTVQ